jgi:hypothetical protein
MVNVTRSKRLAKKAQAALVASIEIYNKPDFFYREESFAILCVNAWELLLKAKIVEDAKQDLKSIYVYEPKQNKNGKPAKHKALKKTDSGEPITIGVTKAVNLLGSAVPSDVRSNLLALIEIRDTSVHFVNPSFGLRKKVLEIGTAAVKNFVALVKHWFGLKALAKLNLYLMPIGFLSGTNSAAAVTFESDEQQLVTFLNGLVASQTAADPAYCVALEVEVAVTKASAKSASNAAGVQWTSDPTAPKFFMTEEQVHERFPWSYDDLRKKCLERYSNFKQGDTFHELRKSLASNKALVYTRAYNAKKPSSGGMMLYNPNILTEFDKVYAKR